MLSLLALTISTAIAAGLRVSPANAAYTAKELAFQYSDSGAKLVFTTKENVTTVREMFKESGISDADGRIVLLDGDESLAWASAPLNSRKTIVEGQQLVPFEDLIGMGSLASEEKFEGEQANETCLLCYSSGTTGKPKVHNPTSAFYWPSAHPFVVTGR